MTWFEVYQLLKRHYEKTGQFMETVPLILQCGNTPPKELMKGRAHFQRELLHLGVIS